MTKKVVYIGSSIIAVLLIVVVSLWISTFNKANRISNSIREKKYAILIDFESRMDKVGFSQEMIDSADESIKENLTLITNARKDFGDALNSDDFEGAEEAIGNYLQQFRIIIESSTEAWNTIGLTKATINEFNMETNVIRNTIIEHNSLIKEFNNLKMNFPSNLFMINKDARTDELSFKNFQVNED